MNFNYRHTSFYCVFVQVYRRYFSNSTCSLRVSVPHFGNSCHISNFFIIIISVTVICDLWCYFCKRLGRNEPRPYKTANLIDKCCVCSDCSTDRQFPRLRGLTPILKEVPLWVKCYQTESHATEKSATINIEARPSPSEKHYDSLKTQMMVRIF
jgi:hypothetical protein